MKSINHIIDLRRLAELGCRAWLMSNVGPGGRKAGSPKLAAIRMDFAEAARPLHTDSLTAAATHVGVDPAVLWSVVVVETSGCGFLPDRRPAILFERHIFSSRTGRRFDAAPRRGSAARLAATAPRERTNTSDWRRLSLATGVRRSTARPGASARSWGSKPLWPGSATPKTWCCR
jgi:hypothetical protein